MQRIVIRIDFTESASPLARWGSSCLDQAGEVAVLHVLPGGPVPGFLPGIVDGLAPRAEEAEPEATGRSQVEAVFGSPIHGIATRTEAVGHDLVVVGSRGLGGIRREVLGGVTSGVLRAAWCPVLVA